MPLYEPPGRDDPAFGRTARDRILDFATLGFAERGFSGVTIRDLAQRAGVNLAAVNYHFRSKDELYRAVIERALDQWTAEAAASAPVHPNTDLAAVIRMIVGALVAPVIEREHNPVLRRLIAWDLLQRPTSVPEGLAASCIGVIEKVLAPHLPLSIGGAEQRLIAQWLVSQCLLLSPAIDQRAKGGWNESDEIEALVDAIARLALAGLGGVIGSGKAVSHS